MYCSHFGLQRLPFNNTPDPTFYYSTPDHEEALATLQYAAQQRKGFVLVTGEIGAGKTLIGRMFLRQIDANATTAVINNTNLTGKQLLAAICTEFGLETPPQASSLELSQRLQAFLLDQFSQNRHVVVLLDEAQNLPDESFEELRMLGNLEADDAKLLQVCILGQPELRARFRKPGMQQLDQRLFRRFHLPALTPEQAASYVAHRLAVAGAAGRELFTPDAIERIVTAAGGVPRIINQICDNALLTAYGQNQSVVDAPIIDLVLERDPVPALGGETHDVASLRDDGADDISAVYGERLADLVQEATHELSTRIAGLSDGKGIVQDQLKAVTVRQKELQRIVSGATTRWLAAKEKLEAYRHEIHDVIRDLTRRCQATQKQMDELARSAAPTEDLKEIREMHRRETARLLQAIREQRAEFQKRIEDAEAGWNETQSRLQQLSTTQVTRDLLAAARAE